MQRETKEGRRVRQKELQPRKKGRGAGARGSEPLGRSIPYVDVRPMTASPTGITGWIPPDLTDLILEFLRNKYPWYPPCEGAVIIVAASGWRCYNGFISFVDTVTWRCPDGTTMTKEGPAIVTNQKCP